MAYLTFTHLTDAGGNPVGTRVNPLIFKGAPDEDIRSISGAGNVAGDHLIIPGVEGKRIKVLALSAFAPGGTPAVTATFTDDIGGPTLHTLLVQAPNQSIFTFGMAASTPSFLFATSAGKGLNMNLSADNQVVANLTYWLDD